MKHSMILGTALWAVLSTATLAAQSVPTLRASEAWIRWLPAGIPSGAYLTLTNTGTAPEVLVGAASPDFAAVSLHQTRTMAGMSDMQPVDRLTIKPGSSVQFAPGGYHIMLMQPTRALHVGDHVPITLQLADGSVLQVSFEVRAPASGGPGGSP